MRRVFATLATTTILLAAGCGGRSYEVRLDKTLVDMRYRKRLDDNLMPPATKTKLETLNIFIRPPKNLTQSKEFLLTVLEPGKFDVADSFSESDKQILMHVLSRVKLPKSPTKKGAPPTPTNRGEFVPDVVAMLNGVYNVEVDSTKAKEESKKSNKFKHLTFEANGKNVQVYFYGTKAQPYEVSLVFEYPKAEQASLVSKIDLCLESFATGDKARRAFTGGGEEEPAEGTGSGSGVAF